MLWKITKIGLALTFIVLFWIFVIGISANQPGKYFNKGNNAVWLGHEWVDEGKTDKEIFELIQKLDRYQIGTVFAHVGPLNANGKIDIATYKYAINFIEKAKRYNKNIEFQAWVGQIRSKLDLADIDVRKNISDQAVLLTKIVGFDGIHFDIEPVWDGDTDFIKLLEEARAAIGDTKQISVALADFIPKWAIWSLGFVHEFKNYNSEVIYSNVAKYADQVVVMAYDTSIKQDWLYRLFLKEQTIWLSNLMEGSQLFVGIPAYDEENESFDPKTENVKNGLKGVISGLNDFRSDEQNFAGIAIYPYWQMSDEEWETYENLWLK